MHAVPTRHASNNVLPVIALIVAPVIAIPAIPVKQRCGAPGFSCTTALDRHGNVHH
jgi:hypothetical protein